MAIRRNVIRRSRKAAFRLVAGASIATMTYAALSSPAAAATGGLGGLVASTVSTVVTPVSNLASGLLDPWGDSSTDKQALGLDGLNHPEKDPGSLYTVTRSIGARSVWAERDQSGRAITGQGVTVALLDSGVQPVEGLSTPGKVVDGPDLSLETNSPGLQDQDSFGHGTFMAGLIAGRDSSVLQSPSGQPLPLLPSQQVGVAPGAKLLALKLATFDGSTDVSQVIAALDWVTQHRNDNGNAVRVINLSFGTDSVQPAQIDPLATAAENAWHHGIVVVVSGGNEGNSAGQLTDPAIDPYVIAVGASDPQHSVSGWANPAVADFSSSGNAARHVDLLAPGTSVVSLRDPGSYIDANHPEGRVAGDPTGRLFRGSGTSQAAAVVSGSAALLLQENPNLTPDQVKAALVRTAHPLPSVSATLGGAGEIDVDAAVDYAAQWPQQPTAAQQAAITQSTAQTFPVADGSGSLEAARGGDHLIDPANGDVLSGEVDVQGQPWVPATWAPASASATAWNGGVWNGARWTGDSWSGANWQSESWDGHRWSGARWSDAQWDGARWSGARWSGARWSDAGWDGARWSDADWDGARWSDSAWT